MLGQPGMGGTDRGATVSKNTGLWTRKRSIGLTPARCGRAKRGGRCKHWHRSPVKYGGSGVTL